MNVQGIKKAMSEGEMFEQLNELDILGVVETWMGEGDEIVLEDHIYEGKVKKWD